VKRKTIKTLIFKSIESSIKDEAIIGDAAYSEKANIGYVNKNQLKLVAMLNFFVTQGLEKCKH